MASLKTLSSIVLPTSSWKIHLFWSLFIRSWWDIENSDQRRRVWFRSQHTAPRLAFVSCAKRDRPGPPMVSWLIDSSQFMTSHVSEPIYLLFASMPSRDLPTMLCVLCCFSDDQIPMLLAVRFSWHLKCGSGSLEMKSNSNIFLVSEFCKILGDASNGEVESRNSNF